MPSNHEEQTSQKFREDQLSARNRTSSLAKPNASDKKAKRIETKKQENLKPIVVDFFLILPRAWKGFVIGIIVGLIPLVTALVLLPEEWRLGGLLALAACVVVGFLIGKALERPRPLRR